MTSLLVFLFVLSLTAAMAAFDPQTEQLPPPTGLKLKWLDPITVAIFWEKPHGLPANASIAYRFKIANKVKKKRSEDTVENLFTQELDSDYWKFQVWTVLENSKFGSSFPATLKIFHNKRKAELVKDFKCVIDVKKLNCSWIPANPSLNLTVSYRMCGTGKGVLHNVKTCARPSSTGEPGRHSCTLQCDKAEKGPCIFLDDTCVFVETDSAVSTFKPQLVINPPLVNVTEENDTLKVTLTSPLPGKEPCMTFTICYKRCNLEECRNTTHGVFTVNIPYDRTCGYEFRAKTHLLERCINRAPISEISDPVTYGVNKPPDRTLAMDAIFISIILSICIILLCYCFRKHRDILWPNIPDPSVIFKQMMNGNSDLKTPGGNLYTPVPEPFSPLQIRMPT